MTSRVHANTEDLTAKQPPGGGGMDMSRLYLCGHKGSTTGGGFRKIGTHLQPIAWRCPACMVKRGGE